VTAGRIVPANFPLYCALAALMAMSLSVQVVRDRGWQPFTPPSGVLWVRSGPLAERLALGFDNIVADVYWIRAVVYFGGQRQATQQNQFDQLFPLLDLVTSLDPHFRIAYRFGAIFLAEPYPGGAGQPDLAIQLLEKGIAADPRRWEYVQDIGFIHYFWKRDFEQAAAWFKRATDVPGAPEWLGPLAATTLAEGGSRESSRLLWTQLRDTTEFEWIRTNAVHRLEQLDAMDSIDELNQSIAGFVATHGRPPKDWREIVIIQRWRGLPVDPTGTLFTLDPATGKVDISPNSKLWPLPDGSPAARQ
jgi:tetratricopeptide (TPR) repeat protein